MLVSTSNKRIINSLLDMDFYKFSMAQVIFHKHSDVRVRYELTNRTRSILLAEEVDVDQLKIELDHVRTLRFDKSILHYLRGTDEYDERMFKEDYLAFLGNLQLPNYFLDVRDGQLFLGALGKWSEVVYWETIMLCILTELRTRHLMSKLSSFEQDIVEARAKLNLYEKIRKLREAHEAGVNITFSDFGTRRRASHDWQAYVVETLLHELPEGMFLGTSDVELANRFGVTPMGTNAHEMPMVYSGIYHWVDNRDPLFSQRQMLKDWEEEYPGGGLSIALPDTFGSESFFKQVFTPEQAATWKGSRHDSGDPFEYGEKMITYYEQLGIDPKTKLIVFSDNLDVNKVIALARQFQDRIKVSFGIGTNLTNDLGFKPASLVVKAVSADGHGLVKLSDNIDKAIGSAGDIERMKRLVGYSVNYHQACIN